MSNYNTLTPLLFMVEYAFSRLCYVVTGTVGSHRGQEGSHRLHPFHSAVKDWGVCLQFLDACFGTNKCMPVKLYGSNIHRTWRRSWAPVGLPLVLRIPQHTTKWQESKSNPSHADFNREVNPFDMSLSHDHIASCRARLNSLTHSLQPAAEKKSTTSLD